MLERVLNLRGLNRESNNIALAPAAEKAPRRPLSPELIRSIHAPVLSSAQDISSLKTKIIKIGRGIYESGSLETAYDNIAKIAKEVAKLDEATIRRLIPAIEEENDELLAEVEIALERIVEEKVVGDENRIRGVFGWCKQESFAIDDMDSFYNHLSTELGINPLEFIPAISSILITDDRSSLIKVLAKELEPLRQRDFIKKAQERYDLVKDVDDPKTIEDSQYNSTFLLYSEGFIESLVVMAADGFIMKNIREAMKLDENTEVSSSDFLALSILFFIIHRLAENPNQNTEKLITQAFNDLLHEMSERELETLTSQDDKVDEFLEIMRDLLYPHRHS